MKTDDLVSMLATGVAPVQPGTVSRRLGLAIAAGLVLAFGWMLMAFGVRPDLVLAIFWPMFWVKLLFPIAIAVAGFVAVQRLARPGVPVRRAWLGVLLPVLAIWVMAAVMWMKTANSAHDDMLWGQTWKTCAFSIAEISLPVFVAAVLALRSLAPTQPALAGAAAGALAGGAGAAVYALHCPELAAPFLAVWYVAGIALPVVAGALLGPRLFRW